MHMHAENGETRLEAAVVRNEGRIHMPAKFDSMKELLMAIETALPRNGFLRRWLQNKAGNMQKKERVGRSKQPSKNYRKRQERQRRMRAVHMERESSDYDSWEDFNKLEIRFVAFEKVVQDMQMEVEEVDMMQAPSFSKHTVHKKCNAHVLVSIQRVKSIALINRGATDNFLNLAFMKKRELEPKALSIPKECKLGEGMTKVTHEYQGKVEISQRRIPLSFYVMNGRSSQGIILGYSFLSKQKVCVDFASHEMKLGDTEVSCLKQEVDNPFVKVRNNAVQPQDVGGKYAI